MGGAVDLDRDVEALKAPAKGWRNKWLVRSPCFNFCHRCKSLTEGHPGDEFVVCCGVYPTAQAARDAAMRDSQIADDSMRYLGPIPVDVA